jgi:hypothetical protein
VFKRLKDWLFWPKNQYLSPDEIVEDAIGRLLIQDIEIIGNIPKEEMIQFHSHLGMIIRNTYGLWEPENPYTNINSEPNEAGFIDDPRHPDAVSQWILERMWERINVYTPK